MLALFSGLFLSISPGTPADPPTAEHPRLVSLDATICATCHEDLFLNRGTPHGPAREDCTTCHRVATAEGGTRITLVEPEPPLCLTCHGELTDAVEGTSESPHPIIDSCLGCHEPHASVHPALLASPAAELCGTCHDQEDLNLTHDGQITPSTDCMSCHQPHGSENEKLLRAGQLHAPFADGSCQGCHRAPLGGRVRLRARGERLCAACHADIPPPATDGGSVHAAMRGARGRAGCLSCHDPHMSARASLLLDDGAKLCGSCHGGILKEATAESGHPPAAEDCLNCHLPHASNQPYLLTTSPRELCQGCHDPADEDLVKSHLGADLESLSCTGCHTPHGAGNPHLLERSLHAPVLDGCESCHEGRFDSLMEDGESALCLVCHEEIGEIAAAAPVPHPALEVSRCADCHNPHASKQEYLVKVPGGGECLDCHEDQAAGGGETAHGVIEWIGCRACHEPHGGRQAKLLRRTGSELCLACHDPSRPELAGEEGTVFLLGRFEVPAGKARSMASLRLSADGERNHPIPNHRVLGLPTEDELKRSKTTYRDEMTCLTCHDPHKGKSKGLLLWGATNSMEACIHCHTK
jgi:predicted CXXCH cytochrome family protein